MTAAHPPGGLLNRLRTEAPGMPSALRRIATRVLDSPESAATASIMELAAAAGTSPATVTRFCRALGHPGYAALRLAIATELGRAAQARWDTDIDRQIDPGDPVDRVARALAASGARAVTDTAAQLPPALVDEVATAIASAGRVEIFGLGSSGNAAREMAFRLERIRVPCRHRDDTHSALTNAALLTETDVAVGISHSGRTCEVIETLTEAGRHGALTVAITSFPGSPLADRARVVLPTQPFDPGIGFVPLSTLHAQLTVLDLLYVTVAQRSFARTSAALDITAAAVAGHRLPGGGRRGAP
ncbi:RpiR family transcriptional regulator [Stackebrandtia albiflava]|uniref:RpiR family transcriptional regulator n=1 Tax=Stackebrandtia albiflava TaxID=406432 RepID=A0A562VEM3_9ACTN|nr:MurR/RpiR family transcriptional regulator [Stackebrandtia albiflava]TWJ16315.1 RpiR family transcriptional regulator [Stackebrandtia albiflava]